MDAKFRSEVRFLDSWSRALRLHQWAKNFLVFVPLIAAHKVQHAELLMPAMLAFLCFGLAASSAYVLNDFLDLDADRKHPYKRDRPFAAGELSLAHGGVVAFVLSLTAMVIAAMSLPPAFVAVLAHRWGSGGRRSGIVLATGVLHLPVSEPRRGQARDRIACGPQCRRPLSGRSRLYGGRSTGDAIARHCQRLYQRTRPGLVH
ncbi:MAG: hypothetical protein E6H76_01575 [Betaproteobacteria bacterium]|nr:MAG: hypothetical protein E6H76_01575 [Betaproteobacteria bacterium]